MSGTAPPPAKVMVKRLLVGGPWKGRTITVPDTLNALECGLTAFYEVEEDGTFGFRSKINAGRGDCPT